MCLSLSDNQVACSGKSHTKKKAATATSIVRIPSSMKIQRQLLLPPTPFIFEMADASRPLKAEATMTEVKYTVKRFCAS